MMNWIKRWRERREQKRKLKELSAFASGFSTLDTLEERGLLAWNLKTRQLFIDSSLAVLMMRNVDAWTNFVNNLFLWQYSKECERAWADYFLKEELNAVHKYKATHKAKAFSRQDVLRIREARRTEILVSDMEAPKIKGFEFFIVSPPDVLTAVGHYDPESEKLEMATWEEVSMRLQTAE